MYKPFQSRQMQQQSTSFYHHHHHHLPAPTPSEEQKKTPKRIHLMAHIFSLYSSVNILVYFQIRYEVNIWETIQLPTFFYMPSTIYFRQIPKYSWLWLCNEINTCQYGYLHCLRKQWLFTDPFKMISRVLKKYIWKASIWNATTWCLTSDGRYP